MPHDAKLVFSIAILVLFIGLLCVRSGTDNAGPDRFWRGGADDPVRSLLFRPDGSLRQAVRLLLMTALLLLAAGIWFVF